MKMLAVFSSVLSRIRLRLLGLATIQGVPTEQFRGIIQELCEDGWHQTSQYEGIDAWIDYGRVKMRKGPRRLTLEWNNWTQGSIEGKRALVEELAQRYRLSVTQLRH